MRVQRVALDEQLQQHVWHLSLPSFRSQALGKQVSPPTAGRV